MKLFWNLVLVAGFVVLGALAWSLMAPGKGPLASRLAAAGTDPDARVLYQYTDASGRVRAVERLDQVPAAQRDQAGRIELPARAAQPAAATGRPEVVIYTTSWCGFCRKMMHELDEYDLRYTNLDIEKDGRARDELLRLAGSTAVPVTVVDGEVIRGYDPDRLARLVRAR